MFFKSALDLRSAHTRFVISFNQFTTDSISRKVEKKFILVKYIQCISYVNLKFLVSMCECVCVCGRYIGKEYIHISDDILTYH